MLVYDNNILHSLNIIGNIILLLYSINIFVIDKLLWKVPGSKLKILLHRSNIVTASTQFRLKFDTV